MSANSRALPVALNSAERQMAISCTAMQQDVWPVIGPYVGGGTLIPAESQTSYLATVCDTDAGIDHFQHCKERKMVVPLSTRVQHAPYLFRSFTIRHSTAAGGKTEYEKLLQRYGAGSLRSTLTIQAYVDPAKRHLEGALWIGTDKLIQYLLDEIWAERPIPKVRAYDGNEFAVVWFEDLLERGFPVQGYNIGNLRRPGHPTIGGEGLYT